MGFSVAKASSRLQLRRATAGDSVWCLHSPLKGARLCKNSCARVARSLVLVGVLLVLARQSASSALDDFGILFGQLREMTAELRPKRARHSLKKLQKVPKLSSNLATVWHKKNNQ